MKRYIILLLFVFAGVNAMAQGMEQETLADGMPIKMLGSMVYKNNRKLDKNSAAACFSALNGVDRSEDYLKYRAGYKTGLGLTIGGASLAIVGFGVSFVGVLVALPHAFAGNETPGADFAIYSGHVESKHLHIRSKGSIFNRNLILQSKCKLFIKANYDKDFTPFSLQKYAQLSA